MGYDTGWRGFSQLKNALMLQNLPTLPLAVRLEWLPPAVMDEASRIMAADKCDAALALRLATDDRMRAVWNELSRHNPIGRLRDVWTTVMAGRVNVPPPNTSNALALFFWVAYTIASLGAVAGKVSPLNLPIAEYRLEAARLRLSAANLRKLAANNGEMIQGESQFTGIHASQIEDAAAFCDEVVEELLQIQRAEAAAIVERDHGRKKERGYIRLLAVEVSNLYGKFSPDRTLARVASVALMKEITGAQVRKWCDSLRKAPGNIGQ
jgi:hypothetical protein